MVRRRVSGVLRARSAPAPATRATFAYECGVLRGEAFVYERLASTNTSVRDLALQGAAEGVVVIADGQSAGQGRHGRSWHSPAGAGFYGSILLRPGIAPRHAPFLTFVAAIAVAEALEVIGARGIEIKWPNDVLANGRKISGILAETGTTATSIEWAVVGIGVNLLEAAVPEDLAHRATSLEAQSIVIENLDLIDPLLHSLSHWYGALLEGAIEEIAARWIALAPMVDGRAVRVDDGREVYEAVTDGITDDGLLRVRREDGSLSVLAAAEVTLSASG